MNLSSITRDVRYAIRMLLRNPGFKAPCWEDMKKLMALLKEA